MLSPPNAIYVEASHWPWDHILSFQASHWSIPPPSPILPAFCSGSSLREALKTRRCSKLDARINTAFCSGLAPNGALKTRRWSGLDAWIVPAFCYRSSPHRALKMGTCFGLNAWIVPAFCSRLFLHKALKMGRCSELDTIYLFGFSYTMLFSAHVERVSVSYMRDF